jgi:aryl-alcohol dehydrogenase-like predicted oxidoreductase
MDYVILAPGLPPSSRLGFGCGSIMGRVGRAESLRAIAAARGAGISHFDVARLYGYGEAETLLGEALRGQRDQVVIASKFGLSAPARAAALRSLKPIAQRLAAAIPGARSVLRAVVGDAALAPDRFSPASAQASLDQSLAALKTDYLDILFLHDCAAADITDELLGVLDRQITAGKIRAYGAATAIEAVMPLHAAYGARLLYQFANSLYARNVAHLPGVARQFIAHSPFQGADRLGAMLAERPELGRDDLHHLMLAYALMAPSVGVVLCSMLDPAHLRANLAVVERPKFTADDIGALTALAG